METYCEKDWITSFKAGKEEIYREFYEKFQPGIFFLTWRWLNRNTADAEDITAISFARLWEHRHDILGAAHARRWLYKVARNEALIYKRRKGYWATACSELKHGLDAEEIDIFSIERTFSRILTDIIKEVDQLPEPTRSIFKNIHFMRKTGSETAISMGLSPSLVCRHDHKAREMIRLRLIRSTHFEGTF